MTWHSPEMPENWELPSPGAASCLWGRLAPCLCLPHGMWEANPEECPSVWWRRGGVRVALLPASCGSTPFCELKICPDVNLKPVVFGWSLTTTHKFLSFLASSFFWITYMFTSRLSGLASHIKDFFLEREIFFSLSVRTKKGFNY